MDSDKRPIRSYELEDLLYLLIAHIAVNLTASVQEDSTMILDAILYIEDFIYRDFSI